MQHNEHIFLAIGTTLSWALTVASLTSVLPVEQGVSGLLSITLTSLLIYGWIDNRRKK